MKNILGVYARFQSDAYETSTKILEKHNNEKEYFKQYLWGDDGKGGLSAKLKSIKGDYGDDIDLILLQFNVNPLGTELKPKPIENYRSKEKSIGVWITINEANFFTLKADKQHEFIKTEILEILELLNTRFAKAKLPIDIVKLIADITKHL